MTASSTSSTDSTPRANLLIDEPGELIASIPALLGFPPVDSLVLTTLTGLHRLRLGAVLRVDLPLAGHRDHAAGAEVDAELAERLRTAAVSHGCTAAVLVVVGGGGVDPPAELPHRELVRTIADRLERAGVVVLHAGWVAAVEPELTWWCYEDPDCNGQLPDPRTVPISAAMAAAGSVVFGSREELATLLAPDPDDVLDRRAELLDELEDAGSDGGVEPDVAQAVARDIALVRAAVADPPADAADDERVVRLGRALCHPGVREFGISFALDERAREAERLWIALTRALPAPERAEPACLLAVSSYLRGEGALASLAIDAALAAQPGHLLARVVAAMVDVGLPPDRLREMLAESLLQAHR